MNHIFQTHLDALYVIIECIEVNWLCKHMKKVRSSQAVILVWALPNCAPSFSQPHSPIPSHSQPLSPTPTHFLKKNNPLPPIFRQKRPTPTHFSLKTIYSHQFSRKVTHTHPFFKEKNSLLPIFRQKRHTPTLISTITTHSHPFFKKKTTPTHFSTKTIHSYPFFNKNNRLPPIFEQKQPIPRFSNKTTLSHPGALLNCSPSHSHPLPATFNHSQAFLSFYTAIISKNDLLWRAFLLIQLISGP